MNFISILSSLPSVILFIIQEIMKESARTGKTPEQLLNDAGIKTAENEDKAKELLARLKA